MGFFEAKKWLKIIRMNTTQMKVFQTFESGSKYPKNTPSNRKFDWRDVLCDHLDTFKYKFPLHGDLLRYLEP